MRCCDRLKIEVKVINLCLIFVILSKNNVSPNGASRISIAAVYVRQFKAVSFSVARNSQAVIRLITKNYGLIPLIIGKPLGSNPAL
jgi:hypothetical protein